jgi:hypothetical protein
MLPCWPNEQVFFEASEGDIPLTNFRVADCSDGINHIPVTGHHRRCAGTYQYRALSVKVDAFRTWPGGFQEQVARLHEAKCPAGGNPAVVEYPAG